MYEKHTEKQEIRRSQFITTYGPGAIIEGPHGPAVILMPELGLFKHLGLRPSDFEVESQSLQRIIGGKIFRMPTNQELGYDAPIYRTKIFPNWHLCIESRSHPNCSVLFIGNKCPICHTETDHQQAVRFVLACPHGHLDDVDWEGAIHEGSKCLRSQGREPFFFWFQRGPTLWDISIECAYCKKQGNMGNIFYNWHECSSRFPERENINDTPKRPHSCSFGPDDIRKPSVLHRGALNLHNPKIISALTIQPIRDTLHELLSDSRIETIVSTLISISCLDKNTLKTALEKSGFSEQVINELVSHETNEITSVLSAILAQKGPETYSQMLEQEYETLKIGSKNGASLPDFEINLSDVKTLTTSGKTPLQFRIAPLSKLKVVMIQHGFTRVDPLEGREIEVCYEEQLPLGRTEKWFPGVELNGEGIFINLDSGGFSPLGEASKEWKTIYDECHKGSTDYKDNLFRDPESNRIELHPLFIWWHSLSHKLLTWLSIDSGYASASLRERIYCNETEGGILIYTSQPGGDGSLGGLIGLAERLECILKDSYLSASSCSNDPFCIRPTQPKKGSYAGSACYACLFLPETSCEHRNMWLDRRLMVENSIW